MANNEIIIIKIGGSILSPSIEDPFDFGYAKELIQVLTQYKDAKFVLVCGGGALSRKYQGALRDHRVGEIGQHLAGVAAINLHATALQQLLGNTVEDDIIRYEDYNTKRSLRFKKQFLVAAAGKPGHSSDYNAMILAKRCGANTVVSLKNTDGVYTRDPHKFPSARQIRDLDWGRYLEIIGNPKRHEPGASYPVDPLASEFARENYISVVTLYGHDFESLSAALEGRDFKGSFVHK